MISIVIPAYNNLPKLRLLLESLREALRDAPRTEVIVVDDCSEEDLGSVIRQDFGFARMERLPRRSGPATARNTGAKIAGNDIVLFLDSDVIVRRDTVARVKKMFEDDAGMAALEGEYDTVPANPGFFPRFKGLEYRSFVRDQEYITVLGPRIGAIRRDVFMELGGFDQSYPGASVEDYEFSHRLHDKGYRIRYDRTLEVKHHFTDTILKQFGLSFDRSKEWARLFARKRKFDNFGTTLPEGLGRFAGFAFLVSLPAAFISAYFMILSGALLVLYIALNRRFFALALREEGAYFTARAVPAHLLISFFITAGFICGIVTPTRRKNDRSVT